MSDFSKQLSLLQKGSNGWLNPKTNPEIVHCGQQLDQIKAEMTTAHIQKITHLHRHKLPRIGSGLQYQSYFLLHEKKDCWKAYQQISA